VTTGVGPGEAVTLGTCLRPDEAALVRDRARRADRSVSAELRRALRDYLQNGDGPSPEAAAEKTPFEAALDGSG
jgi:plasmid stability protein